MPNWEDYKTESKAREALAREVYIVHSMPASSPEEIEAMLPAHLEYHGLLEAEESLAFAGPLSDETGKALSGIELIIYHADSFEEARDRAIADPMHSSGKRSFVLRKWLINEGDLYT